MNPVFALKAILSLDSSEFEKGLDDSKGKAEGFGSKLKSGLGAAAKVGAAAIATATTAVTAFAGSALKSGQEFDSAMSQIAATLGMTTDEIANNVDGAGDTFQALRDKAQEMGAATNFSASQAAEGLNILAMSGFDAQESIAMVEDVLHLAAAGSMDMASAAGYISGAMKGFADDTKDAQYYADLMAKGATLANTSVQQLGEAMSSGAAGAAAYGQSADSMTLSLLRLAEQGEVGAAAGTALSAAMKNLYTPTDQARAALAELGVAAYDEAGNAREFNTVVNELSDALAGMTAEEAANYKQTIFGIQGLDAYNKMTVTGIDKQNQWAEALANASEGIGETAKQYATMTDNLQGDLDILSSSFDGLKLAVSDTLMGSAREFVQFGSKALSAITEGFKEGGIDGAMEAIGQQISSGLEMVLEKLPGLITAGAKLLKALGKAVIDNVPVLLNAATEVIGEFAKSLSEGNAIQEIIKGAVSVITQLRLWLAKNATVLIGAAVTIITELMQALTDPENIGAMVDASIELMLALAQALIGALPQLIAVIPQILENLKTAFIVNGPKLLEAGQELASTLLHGLWDLMPEGMQEGITSLWEKVQELWNTIFGWIQEFWGEHGQQIQEAFDNIGKGFQNAWEFIRNTAEDIFNRIKEFWETWGDTIKAYFEGVWNAVKIVFQTVLDVIVDLFAVFSAIFAGDWEKAWEETKRLFTDLWDNIVKYFKNIWETITNVLKEIWNVVKENVEGIIDTIKEKVGAAMDWLKELPSKAWNWGRDLIQNFISGLTEKWDNLKSTVSDIAGGIKSFLGFSEPEQGPLKDFHTYAPDMMSLFAKGIRDNKQLVLDEIAGLAGDMQIGVSSAPAMTAGGAPIHITVQSILDGKVISETVTRYQRGKAVAMGV